MRQVCLGLWDIFIKLWSVRDDFDGEDDLGGKKRRLEMGVVVFVEK